MERRRVLAALLGAASLTVPSGIRPTIIDDPPEVPLETPRIHSIELIQTNDPVHEGEPLRIGFTVRGTPGHIHQVEVGLMVDGTLVATKQLEVDESGVTIGSIEWTPEEGTGSLDGTPYEVTLVAGEYFDVTTVEIVRPPPERVGITFIAEIDAATELGLDRSGRVPVTSAINDLADGSLVTLPAGEYLVSEEILLEDKTIGLEAEDGANVRFVVPEGYNGFAISALDCPSFYLRGIDLDQTPVRTSTGLRIKCDRFHVEDVEFIGRADIDGTWQVNAMNCAVPSPDGYGEIRNFVHREGHWATYGGHNGGRQGIYAGPEHHGTLRIVDCDIRECSNGIYASRNYGDVHVQRSFFQNNNAAGVRIGGDGSYVEDSTFVTDPTEYFGPRTYEDSSFTHRSIVTEERFDHINHQKEPGVEIRNCDIRVEDNPANGAAIHRYGNGRTLRIVDTHIEYNNNGFRGVVLADSGSFGQHTGADPPRTVEFVNSSIQGTGDVDVALYIEESDESVVDGSMINMTGASQTGIRFVQSTDCIVRNSTIDVPGDEIDTIESDVAVENVNQETEGLARRSLW